AEDGIRDFHVTGVQTCALPIFINENDIVIAISQSGETADTMAAIQLAKEKGATLLGICNVVGSSIPRLTDGGAYTHAGPEIGVRSEERRVGKESRPSWGPYRG